MRPRTIRLRRPATLSVQEGLFVPSGASGDRRLMDEIDRRWDALRRTNPAYYDGRVFHVLGVHRNGYGGCVLHVMDCAYRFFAVQNESFDIGVRALGLKGVVKRDGRYLMGLRSDRVGAYRNLWEFAPGGSMEPGEQPAQLIQRELQEETGLSSVREPTSLAVIFDPVLRCWELVFQLETDASDPQPRLAEYTRLEWRTPDSLPHNLSPIAQQIAQMLGLSSAR